MIKSVFGVTQEPFKNKSPKLLERQKESLGFIQIHAQHGGFSVILGQPGVGKTVLREHIESLQNERDTVVVSISRTLHSYQNILLQLAEAMKLEISIRNLEKNLIHAARQHFKDRMTVYTLIDEAHLLEMSVLRKLRLLFDSFPKTHNLVLFGQQDLLYYLSMTINADIKSRISYSSTLLPLNDDDLEVFIVKEIERVGLSAGVFDPDAIQLILRSVQGNLRLCCKLCHSSLIDACSENLRVVGIRQVNNMLMQPHWRSHEELIKQQV